MCSILDTPGRVLNIASQGEVIAQGLIPVAGGLEALGHGRTMAES
jgi:hypothetical protein